MTDEKRILAKNIKTYRKEHNLSQMEFAEDCGISDVSLCRIERQNSNVSLDTMKLLASRMGASISDLLSDENKISYCLIAIPIYIDSKEVVTYGIGAIKKDIMIDYVFDISDDYNKILSLVKLCNEEALDPIHLHDIAENALID